MSDCGAFSSSSPLHNTLGVRVAVEGCAGLLEAEHITRRLNREQNGLSPDTRTQPEGRFAAKNSGTFSPNLTQLFVFSLGLLSFFHPDVFVS